MIGARRLRGLAATALPLTPVLAILALLFLVPVAILLSRSVILPDGEWSLMHFARLFQSGAYVQSLQLTLRIAAWTALLSVGIGYPLAMVIARSGRSLAGMMLLCVLVPYWAGVLVRTFAWMVLLGRTGAINSALVAAGITDAPVQMIYNFAGVMIGMVNAYVPLAVLIMMSVMQAIDGRLLRAAATLGAGTSQTFWRVYFPLSLPGVAAALLLVFISSLGTFVTPGLLGSGREVMIAQVIIDQVEQLLNWGFAGAVACLLLAAALVIFALFNQLFGMSALTGRAGGPRRTLLARLGGHAGRVVIALLGNAGDRVETALERLGIGRRAPRPGRLHPGLGLAAVLVLCFLVAPMLFIVPVSFTGGSFIEWPPKGFSTKWYEAVLASDQWLRAGLRSVVVGALSAAAAIAIGLPAAITLTRRRFFGQQAVLGFILAPMIVPHILIAVSLFFIYARLGLIGTDLGLILGHVVICLPYTVITLTAVLAGYDTRLDQAAETLGAGLWARLWLITLPLIRPGLVAAFLIAFVTSFEELTIAMFVTGGLSATLPKQLWADMLMAVSPSLAAVSTLMLAVVTVIVIVAQIVRGRGRA